MDTSAAEITFDDHGVCSFCTEFLARSSHIIHEDAAAKQERLTALVERIERGGKGKTYDCVVGVSGGVDSSWTLVKTVECGLRPLAVHMDNGWNSELAQNNIANLVRTLGLDLYTHVIDWPEYRALMQAFFDADVIDVELLYDNAMLAVCFQQARAFGLKEILAGTNQATEGMRMPSDWNWYKRDVRNLKSLGRRFGGVRLRTFPTHSTVDYVLDEFVRGIHWTSFLDYVPYKKEQALATLEKDFGYKRYPYKHYESVFTRFYQGYILPRKFGVDKRLLHFSTLIVSGQMDRASALEALGGIAYASEEDLDRDRRYFLKKMGWSDAQLEAYLQRPRRRHDEFPSERGWLSLAMSVVPSGARQSLRRFLAR